MATWRVGRLVTAACVAVLVVPVAVYAAWAWWDVWKLERFCGEIQPGQSFSSLTALADKHHIDRRYIRAGVADESTHSWFLPIPAPSTIGDTVCAIHYDHDTQTVVTAEMWYD